MNTYLVTYRLGFNTGSMVVKANTQLQAIGIVRDEFKEFELFNVEAELTF